MRFNCLRQWLPSPPGAQTHVCSPRTVTRRPRTPHVSHVLPLLPRALPAPRGAECDRSTVAARLRSTLHFAADLMCAAAASSSTSSEGLERRTGCAQTFLQPTPSRADLPPPPPGVALTPASAPAGFLLQDDHADQPLRVVYGRDHLGRARAASPAPGGWAPPSPSRS